jgi:hypothetical protein
MVQTALRQKLVDNPTFAADFCKVALLVNCGRINTTLACEFVAAKSDACTDVNVQSTRV